MFAIGDSVAESFYGYSSVAFHRNAVDRSSVAGGAPALGNTIELRGVLFTDGSVLAGQSINGAAEGLGTQSATTPLSAAFSSTTLRIGSRSSSTPASLAMQKFVVAAGTQSLATMRSL